MSNDHPLNDYFSFSRSSIFFLCPSLAFPLTLPPPLSTSIVVKLSRTEISISGRWAWVKEGFLDCAKSISNHPALCAFIPPDHLRGLRGFRVVFTCWVLLSLHLSSALSDTSVITCHCNPLEWLASYSALWEPKSLRPLIAHFISHLQTQFLLWIAWSGLLTQPCTFPFLSPLVWHPLSPWLWLRHGPFTVRLCAVSDLPHCRR